MAAKVARALRSRSTSVAKAPIFGAGFIRPVTGIANQEIDRVTIGAAGAPAGVPRGAVIHNGDLAGRNQAVCCAVPAAVGRAQTSDLGQEFLFIELRWTLLFLHIDGVAKLLLQSR